MFLIIPEGTVETILHALHRHGLILEHRERVSFMSILTTTIFPIKRGLCLVQGPLWMAFSYC